MSWGFQGAVGQAISPSFSDIRPFTSHGVAFATINLFYLDVLSHEIAHTLGAEHNPKWYWYRTWGPFGYWWVDIMNITARYTIRPDYHGAPENINKMRHNLGL